MTNRTTKTTKLTATAISLMLVLLAGCSQSSTNTNSPSPSGEAPKAAEGDKNADPAAPKADKTYKISWVTGQSQPVDANAEMIKYWEEKLKIDLDVWNIESTKYADLLGLKFASGEIPDRMLLSGFSNLQKYASQDILAEIPLDMLKKYAPNVYAMTEKSFPNAFNYAKVNGKIYGIPRLSFYSTFRSPIVWRGDWLKNVGIDKAPETLDEFEKAVYKLTKEDPDKNGKNDTYGLSTTALPLVYGAYGYLPEVWAEKDGKLVYGGIQPEMKEALKLLSKWYKDGVIDPEFVTGENKGGYWALSHAFINGRIGLSSLGVYYHWKPVLFEGDGASHDYLEVKKVNPQAADSLLHGMPPKGPNGKMGVPQNSMLSGVFISFGKQLEKEPDKLAKILQVIEAISATSYENYVTAMYGIQGKHWDFDKNQIPALKNNLQTQDLEKMGANSVIESLELPEYTQKRVGIASKWAEEHGFSKGGMVNKLLAPLASEGKYLAELNKMREQYYISIITGDKPIDAFDEFVAKWKSSGGDQLTKEANDWYAQVK
ncbi:extracellular solute-binding protein [Paenibacillus contaminans]|uniref:ABC transporter substrate-binding protein n=1 Tax=Paenibacillus contaminans TaxID=450362 RepID=A0A329M2N7_9BACL|nr:extracellular solute-binding protein [Paenibacillus contaminans]RAV14164.1 ABC transporter substrate-binding protein [Paenibacillus contaminans]